MPIMDPDGAQKSHYDYRAGTFWPSNASHEALLLTTWFEQWVDAGKRLDIALDMHNVESAESEHLFCLFTDPSRPQASDALHQAILDQFHGDKVYHTRKDFHREYFIDQLGGFLGYFYGPIPMLYEINSQEKRRHLSQVETREMGRKLLLGCADYLRSPPGNKAMREIDFVRAGRVARFHTSLEAFNPIERAHNMSWTIIDAVRRRQQMENAAPSN